MAALAKRVNLRERNGLGCNLQIDFKCDDRHRAAGLSTDDYLTSSERSYLSYINPALSPNSSRALIHAKELLKYAEKELSDICNSTHRSQLQETFRPDETDETLRHIQEVIAKKFEEIDNPKTIRSTKLSETTTSKEATERTSSDAQSNLNIRKRNCNYNTYTKRLHKRTSQPLHFTPIQPLSPKKILTARSVQTDCQESLEKNDKLRKLNIQTAPALTIPPALKVQTLKSVHISPNTSMTSDPKNAEMYSFKYDYKTRSAIKEKAKSTLSKEDQPVLKSNPTVDRAVGTCEFELSQTKVQTKEKPPKQVQAPSSTKPQKPQKVRTKRKLDFNESGLSNISLDTIHFSDVDDILQTNHQKLQTVSKKTMEMCKTLHHQVVANNFRNYEKSSSDQISTIRTLDTILSLCETSSAKTDNKEQSIKELNGSFNRHRLQSPTPSFSSIASSDYQNFQRKKVVENSPTRKSKPDLDRKNISEDKMDRVDFHQDDSPSRVSTNQVPHNEEEDAADRNQKLDLEIKSILEDLRTDRSDSHQDKQPSRTSESKIDIRRSISLNNTEVELHVEVDCNIDGSSLSRSGEEDEVFEQSEPAKKVEIDDIKRDVGQEEEGSDRGSLGDGYLSTEHDVESINNGTGDNGDNEDRFSGEMIGVGKEGDKVGKDDRVDGWRPVNHSEDGEKKEEERVEKKKDKMSLFEMKKSVVYDEFLDDFKDEDRYQKYAQKFLDMNRSLASHISTRINEEIKELEESTERILRIQGNGSQLDERRSSSNIPLRAVKAVTSENEQSEGEVRSSSGNTLSLGEVKSRRTSNSINSKELCKLTISSKKNSSGDTSISSNSFLLSLGEIWDKPVHSNATENKTDTSG